MSRAIATLKWCMAVSFLAVVAVITGPAFAEGLTPVSLRLDWVTGDYHAPFFVGVEKGYYKDEGLDVSIEPGNGSATVAQAIGNGNGTFGFVDGATMMNLVSKGLNVKAVMGIYQTSPLAIVFDVKRGIQKPKDLEGKKIGVTNGEAPLILLPAFFKAAGVDPAKVTLVNGSAATKSAILLSGRVDATADFGFARIPQVGELGMTAAQFKYASYGVNVPGNCIIARVDYLKSHPDIVRKFVHATAKAFDWTVGHPAEAVDILIKANPGIKIPRDVSIKVLLLSLDLLHTDATKGQPIGLMSPDDWRRAEDLLAQYQGLKKLGDVDSYMTNEFVQ
jgi:NitT/TauT family transport system substrate-binding protein